MALQHTAITSTIWKPYEKLAFRFLFIYFILQAFPLDWKFYRNLFSVNWLNPQFNDIFNISRYTPQFFHQTTTADFWGLSTVGDWVILAFIAAIAALAWPWAEKKFSRYQWNYNDLYYVLRVVLRYRLAIGVIAYGLIKFFPLQAPYPSLSNFNTNYGDLSAWKIFALTLGVAPTFETFLGGVEILGGLLLLYRRATALGAFIIIIFYGNVFLSNLAYEGGEAAYSVYLLQFAIFLIVYDLPRLVSLLALNKPAAPNTYRPTLPHKWQQQLRVGLKAAFIFFFIFVFGYKIYAAHRDAPYHYPKTPGLANARGIYDVSKFSINGKELPYSKTDTVRWQNVVFEQWSTLSIKTARSVKPWFDGVEIIHEKDKDRLFELAGTTSRHYYHYSIDENRNILSLENKNPYYENDKFQIHYSRPDNKSISVTALTVSGDSIQAVLTKLDKKYLYEEAQKSGRGRLEL